MLYLCDLYAVYRSEGLGLLIVRERDNLQEQLAHQDKTETLPALRFPPPHLLCAFHPAADVRPQRLLPNP